MEQIEYDKTEFFSDVGGAAGLLLGISLTSLIGMFGESFNMTHIIRAISRVQIALFQYILQPLDRFIFLNKTEIFHF